MVKSLSLLQGLFVSQSISVSDAGGNMLKEEDVDGMDDIPNL